MKIRLEVIILLKEILEPCAEVVGQFDNPIFLHVRRGDYAVHTAASSILCRIMKRY